MSRIKFRGSWRQDGSDLIVREVKGAACTLDLPDTLGKTSDKVNIRRLKFFEERDAAFGDYQGPVQPTLDPLGVRRYEIKRIVAHRVFSSAARVLGAVGGL
jgi:hypothetical protein